MIKKVIAASAAAGGLLLASAGTTLADSGARGAAVGSPGVLSGNLVQVPVHIPANVCGNTVDVVGVFNPAIGNTCVNVDHRHHGHGKGGAQAKGVAAKSPGVLSGNLVQLPVHVPVNVCGNTADGIGALNAAFGNDCINSGSSHARHHHQQKDHKPQVRHNKPSHQHRQPATPRHRASVPPAATPSIGHHLRHHDASPARPQLAQTGAEERLGMAAAASAGLLLGGVLLYRRGRRAGAQD
ncbi:chaplin [Streptomyces sp. NPDC048483]|uniref:chaplin n=1 Tax=Streptomyces sp. NPDC048483 TaxID=3154927 RepID=UPI00341F2E3B